MIFLQYESQKRSGEGFRKIRAAKKFMKEIHDITFDNIPTNLQELKIESIGSWTFTSITTPNRLLNLHNRKRCHQQVVIILSQSLEFNTIEIWPINPSLAKIIGKKIIHHSLHLLHPLDPTITVMKSHKLISSTPIVY
jgi:hypothetical protein